MKYLYLFIVLVISFAGRSQSEITTIDGKKYYVHYVEKNQTLYSIHKLYNVSVSAISEANTGASNGLSIGEKLLIPISVHNTDVYQNHVISKGETLYGISKQYKCSVSELKTINPELGDGIQIGQVIKVPRLNLVVNKGGSGDAIITDDKAPVSISPEPKSVENGKRRVSSSDTLVYHTVLSHETLYSIAKRYMVTPDTIRKLNKIKVTNISAGDVLLVPVKKVNYQISKNEIDTELSYDHTIGKSFEIVKKRTYKVVLFLPLMYAQNKSSMNKPLKVGEVEKLDLVTAISADFYHGFKLAVDSLADAGLNTEIFVFDTQRDSNTIKKIIANNGLNDIDMVFGPFFPEAIDYVGRYCKANQIPMVIPFNSGNKVLYNNPYVYKTTASNMIQIDGLIDFVAKEYSHYHVVITKPNSDGDKALFERAKDRYNSAPKKSNVYNSNIVEVSLGSSSGRELNLKLRKDTVNVVIVPSTDVKYVTSVYMRLNNVLNSNTYARDMKIIVFGLEDWNKIEDIDLKHRMRMEQHYASYRYLDYDSEPGYRFFNAFRKEYGTDPDIYGVQGFDVGYYFLSALYMYGKNFNSYLPDHDIELIQNKFRFSSVSESDGKENSSICIVKYCNYSLKFVSW